MYLCTHPSVMKILTMILILTVIFIKFAKNRHITNYSNIQMVIIISVMIAQLFVHILIYGIYFQYSCLASLMLSFVANTKHSVAWMHYMV